MVSVDLPWRCPTKTRARRAESNGRGLTPILCRNTLQKGAVTVKRGSKRKLLIAGLIAGQFQIENQIKARFNYF